MRKILTLLLCLLLCLLTTACGFNHIMVKELSNPESYGTFTVTVSKIQRAENGTYIYVTFGSYEDVELFHGSTPNKECPLEDYQNRLEVTEENNKILTDNGFYDKVKVGDTITVRASHFIYMDGNFFYIASVVHNDTEYLNFDTGLANIVKMMKANPGL